MAEKERLNFRWKSWLGLSVALFLLYGVVNVFFAIMVPYSLHTQGAGAMGGGVVLATILGWVDLRKAHL